MAEPALFADGVSKAFEGLVALDDVSVALRPGEIAGLIGPNGSGKTTLLNVVSGVLVPDAGRVVINGIDTAGWPAHRVSAIGLMRTFQNIRLFSALTVLENTCVGAAARHSRRPSKGLRSQAFEVLEFLDLVDVSERFAATLPYGLQRRVEIARALAADPDFVLLDEPAAGMNEAESDELLLTIRNLPDRLRRGVLVVDHDLRLIMRLCDRIYVLNEGKLIKEGTPEEVRRDPDVIAAYLGHTEATPRTA